MDENREESLQKWYLEMNCLRNMQKEKVGLTVRLLKRKVRFQQLRFQNLLCLKAVDMDVRRRRWEALEITISFDLVIAMERIV